MLIAITATVANNPTTQERRQITLAGWQKLNAQRLFVAFSRWGLSKYNPEKE